jgi:hypothetical protein
MNRRAECVGPDRTIQRSRARRRARMRRRGGNRLMGFAYILAALTGCLSDEATSRVAGKAESADGKPGTSAAIAPPPGGIVNTEPDSGWTEGSFSVNHNGAAEYHLPLWVPDGRGGLKPELALHYNSQGGNGLVGVGWSLSAGLSSISPCPRTLARDGRVENAGLGKPDAAYCMDGQRLRPVSGGGTENRTTAPSVTPSPASGRFTARAATCRPLASRSGARTVGPATCHSAGPRTTRRLGNGRTRSFLDSQTSLSWVAPGSP